VTRFELRDEVDRQHFIVDHVARGSMSLPGTSRSNRSRKNMSAI